MTNVSHYETTEMISYQKQRQKMIVWSEQLIHVHNETYKGYSSKTDMGELRHLCVYFYVWVSGVGGQPKFSTHIVQGHFYFSKMQSTGKKSTAVITHSKLKLKHMQWNLDG